MTPPRSELLSLPAGALEAMEATFTLCEAINQNELTINDLIAVCRLAIEDGHDMAQIDLTMMATAISRAKDET